MRVYISVDMEGVAGVAHEDQTDPIEPRHAGEYNRFRRLMTNEANAAIAGALEAGAKRVLVNDSHWLMRNLLAEELNPAAELLSGGPEASFDGGRHRHGLRCSDVHRVSCPSGDAECHDRSHLHESCVRGTAQREPAGELALNAAMAGVHGVAVAMVSGDQALAAEARALLGDAIETVIVKDAVGRFAARSLAPIGCVREDTKRRDRGARPDAHAVQDFGTDYDSMWTLR